MKRLHKQTPFQLVYGFEAMIQAEFVVPSVTTHIVLNDKIPNPQGTTQGAILGWPLLSP
jgi:hypothetical protein